MKSIAKSAPDITTTTGITANIMDGQKRSSRIHEPQAMGKPGVALRRPRVQLPDPSGHAALSGAGAGAGTMGSAGLRRRLCPLCVAGHRIRLRTLRYEGDRAHPP